MIQYMKESRLLVTRYLCGKPIKARSTLVKTRKGFPVWLNLMKPLIRGNIESVKFMLTVLNITRGLEPNSSDKPILPDFSTVDGPYTGKIYVIPA
jgi:hypothetical protein